MVDDDESNGYVVVAKCHIDRVDDDDDSVGKCGRPAGQFNIPENHLHDNTLDFGS